jgi:hypothetical protein
VSSDGLRELGLAYRRKLDMPATPEKIWPACRQANPVHRLLALLLQPAMQVALALKPYVVLASLPD